MARRFVTAVTLLPITILSLLACSGAMEEGFKEGFMEEFPKACAQGLEGTVDDKKANDICTCAGEKLIEDNDIAELMGLLAAPDSDETKKVFEPIIKECVEKFGGADGGGDKEEKEEKGGKSKGGKNKGGDDEGGEKGGKSKGGKSKGGKGKGKNR